MKFNHEKNAMHEALGMSEGEFNAITNDSEVEKSIEEIKGLLSGNLEGDDSLKQFVAKCVSLIIEVLDESATPRTLLELNLIPDKPSKLVAILTKQFSLTTALTFTNAVMRALERLKGRIDERVYGGLFRRMDRRDGEINLN